MALGVPSDAACMAWPRFCTSRRPSANVIAPAKDQCGVLTEAQARCRHAAAFRGRLALAKAFQGGQAGHENGRLADDRGIEPLGRAAGADVQKVVAEDVGGLFEEIFGGRQFWARAFAMPTDWAPWPGKRKADLDMSHPLAPKKGTGPICAKHPKGRSGKWGLSPFSVAASVLARQGRRPRQLLDDERIQAGAAGNGSPRPRRS